MVYNYNVDRGKYPDEKGYHKWTGFENEKLIPGATSSKCVNNSQIVNDTLIDELHKHIKFLYEEYKINIKHRVNIKPFKRSFCND